MMEAVSQECHQFGPAITAQSWTEWSVNLSADIFLRFVSSRNISHARHSGAEQLKPGKFFQKLFSRFFSMQPQFLIIALNKIQFLYQFLLNESMNDALLRDVSRVSLNSSDGICFSICFLVSAG